MIQRSKNDQRNWRHSGSPRPKKFKTQKSLSKVLAPVFRDKDRILLVDYLGKGATITAKYYIALLDKRRGNLSKEILFLQNKAALHKAAITHLKWTDLRFEVPKQQAYPRDLAPSDYYLFPNRKKHLKGRKFSRTEEATSAADGWFAAQPKKFFLGG
jgi:hypothetical protein